MRCRCNSLCCLLLHSSLVDTTGGRLPCCRKSPIRLGIFVGCCVWPPHLAGCVVFFVVTIYYASSSSLSSFWMDPCPRLLYLQVGIKSIQKYSHWRVLLSFVKLFVVVNCHRRHPLWTERSLPKFRASPDQKISNPSKCPSVLAETLVQTTFSPIQKTIPTIRS